MKTILNKIRSLASGTGKSSIEHETDPIFAVRHDTASVTNYEKLYAQNYYAHQTDSTSYDIDRFPKLLLQLAEELLVNELLDIGGGNGKLSQIWRNSGGRAASLDYYDNPEEFCKKFDLSRNDTSASADITAFISQALGKSWISTCLDVAEHIDIEHLADFMLNLKSITGKALVISISTRPSSQANSFHSTVLPIETWKKIFVASGFEIYSDNYFDELVKKVQFVGSDEEIISVSHWHKINPYRDTKNHQHYLILKNANGGQPSSLPNLRQKLSNILDISYRWEKRDLERPYPKLTYSIHFIQDWAFARSIMDAWPADKLRFTLREDCISQSYLKVIKGFLRQKGIEYTVLSKCSDALSLISDNTDVNEIWVTATEGNHSITHQMNSIVMGYARQAGYKTFTLQHGMTAPSSFSPASEVLIVWNQNAIQAFSDKVSAPESHSIEALGSPKLFDALIAQGNAAIENRLGAWTKNFDKKVLLALNLHWSVHDFGSDDTYSWIKRLVTANPTTLFFLKPHPDDSSIYEFITANCYSNVILIDDILLTSMDWPLMRLLKGMDGVISTLSTLILDSVVAGIPVVRLAHDSDRAFGTGVSIASFPNNNIYSIPSISADEWSEGRLPLLLKEKITNTPPEYLISHRFFDSLVKISRAPNVLDFEPARISMSKAISESIQYVNFNQNPHRDIQKLDEAIHCFLS